MPKAVVLGCGKVGSVMARDLAGSEGWTVVSADPSEDSLAQVSGLEDIETRCVDCSDQDVVRELAESHDIVLGALPSTLGYRAMETTIRTGTPMCDISFMTDDFLALDGLAKEHGVTVIPDCGVAPGMSNMLSGWGVSKLDRADFVEILVGGIPRERFQPWEYKAGFSPYDVIEEYVRPSRVVENGEIVIKEALSEPELIDFPGIGTLESFNTDGLRTLAETLDVPTMRERTMRYPGHIALARAFRDTGLFSEEPVEVNGVEVASAMLAARGRSISTVSPAHAFREMWRDDGSWLSRLLSHSPPPVLLGDEAASTMLLAESPKRWQRRGNAAEQCANRQDCVLLPGRAVTVRACLAKSGGKTRIQISSS